MKRWHLLLIFLVCDPSFFRAQAQEILIPRFSTWRYKPGLGPASSGGDAVELYKPGPAETTARDQGFVPYLLVDKVHFENDFPWPSDANGQGLVLQRRNSLGFGNDPANWLAGPPTPGKGREGFVDDRDADGIPDSWEALYLLDPLDPRDANADFDADGRTNREEYVRGSDPYNASSFLNIDQVRVNEDTILLRFLAFAGESYSVQYRDSLSRGLWIKLADVSAAGITQTIEIQDTADGSISSRFYRLVTPRLP